MTHGEFVIRPDFARDAEVKQVKEEFAKMFDKIHGLVSMLDDTQSIERTRLALKALDSLETAALYAVKALTA